MAKVKIGDIIEIRTKKGLAYAQYTHRDDEYGYLIQVKKGIYGEQPVNLDEVANSETRIIAFVPLSKIVHKNMISVVGNVSVPVKFRKFPLFRARGVNLNEWYFWDGGNIWPEKPIKMLTMAQKNLPIKSIRSITTIIEDIEFDRIPD